MGRIAIFFLCITLLIGTVFGDNQTDRIHSTITVDSDGSALVELTAEITLEEAVEHLTFPIPKGAQQVTYNDVPVGTAPSPINASVDLVALDDLAGVTGMRKLVLRYTLPSLLVPPEPDREYPDGQYLMRIPLLSGFEFPVQFTKFTIIFPEGTTGTPSFYSGYFLQSIESDLTYQVDGSTITGTIDTELKDKETLHMDMMVTLEQFPHLVIVENQDNLYLYGMLGLAGLALVFWLVFLGSLPVFSQRRRTPPVGIHAGELGSRMTMEGGDLTMLVFHWAQLGYIRMVPDKQERVWLHKRMEMGNERSDFEVKCFRQLFGRNQCVEGTGSRYGRLWVTVKRTLQDAEEITRGGLWARGIFRFLFMLVSTLVGVVMGLRMVEDAPWQYVAMAGFALLGSFTGWKMQAVTMKLHLRNREGVPFGILCAILWLGTGFFTDCLLEAALSTLFQLLAGVFTAWGGRRAPRGRQIASQVLGLRRYLKGIKRQELKEELERNPDYFFEMAPYAMAMGVDNAFANRMGDRIMPPCSYLEADRSLRRNARGWIYLMQFTAKRMDNAGKRARKYRKR